MKSIKRCKHGKLCCCECNYGKIRMQSKRYHDTLDEMNAGYGYKLVAGFSLIDGDKTFDKY